MKTKELILKIGGAGGSIKLFKINNQFVYTTDESTLMDLLNEEDHEGIEFKSSSELFDTFDLAMTSMMNRYPVFRLYPVEISDDYRTEIKTYYQNYRNKNMNDNWGRDEWEQILNL